MTQPGDSVDRSFVSRRQSQLAAEKIETMEAQLAKVEAEAHETAKLVAAMIKSYRNNGMGYEISVKAAEDPNHQVVQTIPGTIPASHSDTA